MSKPVGLGLALIVVGCSFGPPPLPEGVVTLDGAPLVSANVMLVSEEAVPRPVASGDTDREGKFKLRRIGEGSGIPAGTYKVLVVAADPTVKIPSQYNDPAQTPLSAKIPAASKLELKVAKQ
jgi:hypothetical protein